MESAMAEVTDEPAHEREPLNVYLWRDRLQVFADVDANGLERLIAVVEKLRDFLPAKQSA